VTISVGSGSVGHGGKVSVAAGHSGDSSATASGGDLSLSAGSGVSSGGAVGVRGGAGGVGTGGSVTIERRERLQVQRQCERGQQRVIGIGVSVGVDW